MKKYLWLTTFIGVAIFQVVTISSAHAAFTFDATSTGSVSAKTTETSTITVGSGSNELLVIELSSNSAAASSTGVSVNGVAATRAAFYGNSAASRSIDIWYALGLASGVNTVSATWAANHTGSMGLISFFGSAQSNPIDATSTGAGGAAMTSVSSTITTLTANDLLIDGVAIGVQTATGLLNSNQISLFQNGGATIELDASYYPATSTSAYKLGWTLNSGALAYQIVAFKPAATPVASSFVEHSCVIWN